MGVFTFIDDIKNIEMFKYAVIVIILLFLFLKLTIGLNIILALFFGYLIILYLDERDEVKLKLKEKNDIIKYDTIQPRLDNVSPDSEIVDFLFSIQDLYVYNPQAYEEMIANLESFFSLMESIFNEHIYSSYYYQILGGKKDNALNALQSIIFKLPTEKNHTIKLNMSHQRLETILNKYMNDAYDKCQYYIKKNGYTLNVRPTDVGPKGANLYDNEKFSYQFY